MVEECASGCSPLFGDRSCDRYSVKSVNRSVMCKTRSVSNVKSSEGSANNLFADNLWPGCYVLSDILDLNQHLCVSKSVLELGAGCALPSLVAAVLGASVVVATDYPEPSVIQNIKDVCESNQLDSIIVQPYAWGDAPGPLLSHIQHSSLDETKMFDLILGAELLWRDTHAQHENLLYSIAHSLCKQGGIAIVTFVHRPTASHLSEHDLEFFEKAQRLFGMRHQHIGVCSGYKDCLDESEDYANVQVYALYFDSELPRISIPNNSL